MSNPEFILNESIAAKVLSTVDAGLCHGMGIREPGKMCVEAAVCYAMGLPHSDNPTCVSPALRALKIRLNDSNWSGDQARATGLRRLAIAQLGSAGQLDEVEFVRRVTLMVIKTDVAIALRAAASIHPNQTHAAELNSHADKCASASDVTAAARAAAAAARAAYAAAAAARAARAAARAAAAAAYAAAAYAAAAYAAAAAAAAYAAAAAARDKMLSEFAERVVQILVQMNAPGCQYLYLTER